VSPVIDHTSRDTSRLTARELDVLQLAADGVRTAQAAEWLEISPATVRTHRFNILRKLDCHSLIAAVAMGFREGVLT
jgi:DNA-binding NarL/FixJ family response regulator